MDEHPELQALRRRLDEVESAYAHALGTLDALAALPPAFAQRPALAERLNAQAAPTPVPVASGAKGAVRGMIWSVVAPAVQRQEAFDSTLVQLVNGHLDEWSRLHDHLARTLSALVQYLQRVLPLVDARDRVATGLATTRAELILEAFDRRMESLGRRVAGLGALRDRMEAVSEEVRAIRRALEAGPPPPAVAAAASAAAHDASYVAFENRYRGETSDIRARLADYVPLFAGLAPVADLGCGRGEFLDLLRAAGIEGRGVESNARAADECRARGLEVIQGDLLAYLRAQPAASLGGVFAAQVAEHLPPPVLHGLLAEAFRVLRPGGLLLLETVNPRSVMGFLEVYIRDLTHERPLHPDTLSFLAAAAGFTDVRVEMRAQVDAASRLQPVPVEGLPEPAARALNENVERLNAVVFGPQEYALLARR